MLLSLILFYICFFFFQAEDGIRDLTVTGVQTCALPIWGYAAREELDQAWIARAAARGHQLVGGPSGRPALNPSRDGLHGQRRRRRYSVVVGAPRPLHVVQEPRGVVRAEPFAPRALGRRRGEVGVREQGLEHLAGRLAAPCPLDRK